MARVRAELFFSQRQKPEMSKTGPRINDFPFPRPNVAGRAVSCILEALDSVMTRVKRFPQDKNRESWTLFV